MPADALIMALVTSGARPRLGRRSSFGHLFVARAGEQRRGVSKATRANPAKLLRMASLAGRGQSGPTRPRGFEPLTFGSVDRTGAHDAGRRKTTNPACLHGFRSARRREPARCENDRRDVWATIGPRGLFRGSTTGASDVRARGREPAPVVNDRRKRRPRAWARARPSGRQVALPEVRGPAPCGHVLEAALGALKLE